MEIGFNVRFLLIEVWRFSFSFASQKSFPLDIIMQKAVFHYWVLFIKLKSCWFFIGKAMSHSFIDNYQNYYKI